MSEIPQEGAPAVASVDPANLSGPGVTAIPDNASQVHDLAAVAEENAQLRAQLIAENERLKSLLATSQEAGALAQGLTDEDVRRLEHPEEYLDEYAALGEHEALKQQLASLDERFRAAEAARAQQAQPAPREAAAVTADPLNDPSQTFASGDPNAPAGPAALAADTPAAAADVTTDPFATLTDAQLADELARREAAGGVAP